MSGPAARDARTHTYTKRTYCMLREMEEVCENMSFSSVVCM